MALCVMRLPPASGGHGGSQRAWWLLNALARLEPLDFVLIRHDLDRDAANYCIDPVRSVARSVTILDIPEWRPVEWGDTTPLGPIQPGWLDVLRLRSHEAPVFDAAVLRRIAEQLPVRSADLVFAGRLPSAILMDALTRANLFEAGRKVADFDDIMSNFRRRQLETPKAIEGRQARALARIDMGLIRRAEKAIATSWDAVSVCTDHDVAQLRASYPTAHVHKVPNIVERDLLEMPRDSSGSRVLFVGNLSFSPNVQGLELFIAEAWPIVRAALPEARLSVVGMFPTDYVYAICQAESVEVHADVASLEPYYAESDIVLAPIFFGGGTRIKILEAMAFGRPVVSSTIGAEGLDIQSGTHAIIADTMPDFATAVIRLARDPGLRATIANNARELQQRSFSFHAMARCVEKMVAKAPGSDHT